MAGAIFVNYRRADEPYLARILFERIVDAFRDREVFMDVESIPAGSSFREVIEDSLGETGVVLAVVGRRWLEVRDEQGRPRLENPEDWVRVELETARSLGCLVIPVLAVGVAPPRARELPEGLQWFAGANALRVTAERVDADIDGLVRQVRRCFEEPRRTRRTEEPIVQGARKLRGAEGHGWWDAGFTGLLLDAIPPGPGKMVDVYCRAGMSATLILPERPLLTWIGVDKKAERLSEAEEVIAAHGLTSRTQLIEGNPGALPLADGHADYAIAIRALANLAHPSSTIEEAFRVLRPRGRFVTAEPDGLSETFYFEGNLQRYNAAFSRLAREVDRRLGGDPGATNRPGITIGPTLPSRLVAAGFSAGVVRIHGSHNLQPITFARLARRLRRYPVALASVAGMEDSTELDRLFDEVADLESRIPGDRVGMGGHLLPLFLAVGLKDPDA